MSGDQTDVFTMPKSARAAGHIEPGSHATSTGGRLQRLTAHRDDEQPLGGGVRVVTPFRDSFGQPVQVGVSAQLRLRQRQDLRPRPRDTALRTVGTVMRVDGLDEFSYPFALCGNK